MYDRSTHVSLLESLAQGPRSASWTRFCEQYGDLIRGFARRQGLQPGDWDDVLQDVLMNLVRDLPKFQYDPARGRFRGYLKTVTLHVIYKRVRRASAKELDTQVADAAGDAEIDAAWEAEWRSHHVRQAMRAIDAEFNDKDRQAFQLYAVEGGSPTEVATTLGITPDQVYQAKSRVARRLAELIEAQIAEEG